MVSSVETTRFAGRTQLSRRAARRTTDPLGSTWRQVTRTTGIAAAYWRRVSWRALRRSMHVHYGNARMAEISPGGRA